MNNNTPEAKVTVLKCAMPNCDNRQGALRKRGKNSPSTDKSKRSKWCTFHRKGNGKAARQAYQQELKDAEES